jgi:hypothetical protein
MDQSALAMMHRRNVWRVRGQEDHGDAACNNGVRKLKDQVAVEADVEKCAIKSALIKPSEPLGEAVGRADYSPTRHFDKARYINGHDCVVLNQEDRDTLQVVGINVVHLDHSDQPGVAMAPQR